MLTLAFVLSVYKLTIMGKKSLQIQQLNSKMLVVASFKKITPPPTGWIKAVRTALGMSLQQLGNKISITKQSLTDIERREKDGSITLKTLRDAANALDMELVYGFVPKDGSLDALIDRKAKELATQIVFRTSNTMKLEDQGNSNKRIQKAIEERAASIKNEMPKILWD
jgi:predicted DNA-binding mobile mystery protein A